MTITGSPVFDLGVISDTTDASLFAYLMDLAPDGTQYYITEGMLRGLHRKLSDPAEVAFSEPGPFHSFSREDGEPMEPGTIERFEFGGLPISYHLPKGHRLQVGIAALDRAHFDPIDINASKITIAAPSEIRIPVEPSKSLGRN
jgi:predicted acyl esterase